MRNNKTLFGVMVLASALWFAPTSVVLAEELRTPVGSQADRAHGNYPKAGLSQSSVRAKWGNPLEIRGPVGEPPITQWDYQDFVVYFENDLVLHTVLKRRTEK